MVKSLRSPRQKKNLRGRPDPHGSPDHPRSRSQAVKRERSRSFPPKNPALFGKKNPNAERDLVGNGPLIPRRCRLPQNLLSLSHLPASPIKIALILPHDECPPPRQIFDASEGVAASRTPGRGDRWRRTVAPAAGSRWRRVAAAPEWERGAARATAAARSCRRCCRRASARCRGSWSTTAC